MFLWSYLFLHPYVLSTVVLKTFKVVLTYPSLIVTVDLLQVSSPWPSPPCRSFFVGLSGVTLSLSGSLFPWSIKISDPLPTLSFQFGYTLFTNFQKFSWSVWRRRRGVSVLWRREGGSPSGLQLRKLFNLESDLHADFHTPWSYFRFYTHFQMCNYPLQGRLGWTKEWRQPVIWYQSNRDTGGGWGTGRHGVGCVWKVVLSPPEKKPL